MQLALQTLIHGSTGSRTVQPADDAWASSAELSGFRFSELMHAPAPGLSPASTGAHMLPVAGMPLPAAGNALPAIGDLLAAANPIGVLSADISDTLDETDRRLPKARPDSTADGPYAHSPVAEAVRNMNAVGNPEPVPQGPLKDTATAGIFTAKPQPAVSTAASNLVDQFRNPDEVSAQSQTLPHNSVQPSPALPPSARDGAPGHRGDPGGVLPPVGLRESAFSGRRPAVARESLVQSSPVLPLSASRVAPRHQGIPGAVAPPAGLRESAFPGLRPANPAESHGPAVAIVDQLSQPQTPRKGTPAPFIQEPEIKRSTDSQPGNRVDAARLVIAKARDNRAYTANRVNQEPVALKMPAETHEAKPSLSLATPAVQPAIAAVALSGASPASSMSATAPVATVVTIDTPVFDPAWADALQNRVLWLAGRNIQSAEIRLNPAELGPLQVQISVDDNSVEIAFRATQAITREALEIALPRLRDMLAENGMSLADASVSEQGSAEQKDDRNRSGAADSGSSDEDTTQAVSDLLPDRHTTKEPTGLVDTYV